MKKILSIFAAATLAFGFTACEDVPAPYQINDGKPGEVVPPAGDGLIDETFSTGLGSFSAVNTKGNYSWNSSYSCAQVTSYTDDDGDGTKENNEAESWLVSKPVDLSEVEAAHVSFDYILRYANSSQMKTHYQLLASKDYTAGSDIAAATWTELPLNLVQGSDWDTWYSTGDIALPTEFCGVSGVCLALRYVATTKAATWEVKNFKLQEGEAQAGEESGEANDEVKKLPYTEEFSTTMGAFKSYTTSGKGEWIIDFKTAKATGYDNATKVTTAGTYYLVSPQISLEGQTEAHVSYEYILRYDKGQENQQVYISTSFDEAKPAEGWTLLNGQHTEGTDWNTFSAADLQIPAEYMGKTIRLAFRYNTNAESGSTWEVKNFAIQSGKAGEPGNNEGEDTPDTPVTGDNLLQNGDFEGWSGGKPNHWKTASTAGNATLKQSTDAHRGSYSVEVTGATSANKRLGYKETTFKKGTYTMRFFVKAATAGGGSVRPGYATFKEDGTINGSGYTYGEYVNDLTNTAWTEVVHTFTLEQDQQICLVVMNAKKPGLNVLIDDFTLATEDGGIVGGGAVEPEEPEQPTEPADPNAIFSESFAAGQGNFTIEDKQLPEGGTYVWKAASYQGDNYMKASAFIGSAKAAESWLISPVVDLSGVSAATLSFEHTGKYFGTLEKEAMVWAKAEGGEWKQLAIDKWFANTDYVFVTAGISLNEFAGQKMQFAFVYKSSTEAAGTWEVKNVVVK